MCMNFNPNASIIAMDKEYLKYYTILGRIIGKALMDIQIIPNRFIQPIYKHMMGWPITFKDLEHIDDQVYRNLNDLLDMTSEELDYLMLDFTTTEDRLGQNETIELVVGGNDLLVNSNNIIHYLVAQLKYRIHDRIEPSLTSFLKGFYDIIPETLLTIFDFQELELLIHGLPTIDIVSLVTHVFA